MFVIYFNTSFSVRYQMPTLGDIEPVLFSTKATQMVRELGEW
jgi:hypothetical protein